MALPSSGDRTERCSKVRMRGLGRLVSISTPLTQEVAAFVSMLQSKGSAVLRVDDAQVFRQAIRVEARRRGVRVRTGIAGRDPNVVWACDPDWKLSDEEFERASRRAVNQLAALLAGPPPPACGVRKARVRSCRCSFVFMDQSAKAISAYDPARRQRRQRWLATRSPLADSLVWPCLLVVLEEFPEHVLQVAMTHDQQLVQALAPGCPHPPLGE
jgi:hypothetical protein